MAAVQFPILGVDFLDITSYWGTRRLISWWTARLSEFFAAVASSRGPTPDDLRYTAWATGSLGTWCWSTGLFLLFRPLLGITSLCRRALASTHQPLLGTTGLFRRASASSHWPLLGFINLFKSSLASYHRPLHHSSCSTGGGLRCLKCKSAPRVDIL